MEGKMKPYMASIKVIPEVKFNVIKVLYKEILKKDKYWHFLYEGDHSLIRCQVKNVNQVGEYLEQGGKYKAELIEPWIEPWEFTRKYQKHFRILFHEFSIMSIVSDGSNYISSTMLERIAHCFINMHSECFSVDRKGIFGEVESQVLSKLTANRIFTNGYCARWAQESKTKKGENNETDKK